MRRSTTAALNERGYIFVGAPGCRKQFRGAVDVQESSRSPWRGGFVRRRLCTRGRPFLAKLISGKARNSFGANPLLRCSKLLHCSNGRNSMDDQFSDQVNRTADAATRAAQASRRTMDEGGKAASQIAEHAARAHEQITHRAADAGMRGAGIVKATIETGIEAAVHSFERIAEHFTTAMGFAGPEAEKVAARSRENLHAISQANS